MWERYRTPYSLNSGGVGSGLFKSTDAGATWTEIKGSGYPEGPKGRIGIAISRSNPQVVYALTEAASIEPGPMKFQRNPAARTASIARPTAARRGQHMNNIDTRPFYYSQVRVDPKNPESRLLLVDDHASVERRGQDEHERRRRACTSTTTRSGSIRTIRERWVVGMDGGIAITYDRGGNFWYPRNLPIGQFYDASFDYAIPYNVCSGAQDNGAWCGPSKRRTTPSNNT